MCSLLLASVAMAQTTLAPDPAAPSVEAEKPTLKIPAGTRVPLSLKQAISTKTAREGDPVYAETAFPFVVNERVLIPAGTYIQGKIKRVQRGGHVKGRAEVLIHFTSMIYPSGYTVMLGGSIENTPGAEHTSMKDSEGTIRQDSDAGKKARSAARELPPEPSLAPLPTEAREPASERALAELPDWRSECCPVAPMSGWSPEPRSKWKSSGKFRSIQAGFPPSASFSTQVLRAVRRTSGFPCRSATSIQT